MKLTLWQTKNRGNLTSAKRRWWPDGYRRNAIKTALEALNQNTAWRCDYDEPSDSFFIKRKKLGEYGERT